MFKDSQQGSAGEKGLDGEKGRVSCSILKPTEATGPCAGDAKTGTGGGGTWLKQVTGKSPSLQTHDSEAEGKQCWGHLDGRSLRFH